MVLAAVANIGYHPGMAAKKPTFRDDLRRAIRQSGLSVYAIAKATEIPQSSMSRFLSGERGFSFEAVEAICDLLGLRLVAAGKPKSIKQKHR